MKEFESCNSAFQGMLSEVGETPLGETPLGETPLGETPSGDTLKQATVSCLGENPTDDNFKQAMVACLDTNTPLEEVLPLKTALIAYINKQMDMLETMQPTII